MTRSRNVIGVMALAVISGCASIEKERGHSELAQSIEQRTGFKTHWENGTPEDEEIARTVKTLLEGGLTKERAVEIALVNNPRLQSTYESLGVSQADMVQAGLLKNPTFSGSVGFPVLTGIIETEFELAQDFLDLFMLPLRKRVAAQQFSAEVSRVTDETLSVVAETSRAFIEVQTAQNELELARSIRDGARAALDLAEAQRHAGNITELELASHRANAAQAELDVSRSELQLAEGRERVNRLLGLFGDQTRWTLAAELPPLPESEPALEHLEAQAIRDRFDVQAARIQSELMENALHLARVSRATGFVNIGIHTHQDPDGPRLTGPTLSLELPIFDQRTAMISRLEAEARQAKRNLDAVSIEVRSDVRLAVARLTVARRNAEQYRTKLLPARETVLAQSQLHYNAMQLGLYALLTAKREQSESYRGYLEALRDYWFARADLERALGSSLERAPRVTEGASR